MMRFYRALLYLYPAGFREEYRHELCATFAERMREHTGLLAPLFITLAAIGDVVPNALAVHSDILRQDLRCAARSLRRTPGFAVTAMCTNPPGRLWITAFSARFHTSCSLSLIHISEPTRPY